MSDSRALLLVALVLLAGCSVTPGEPPGSTRVGPGSTTASGTAVLGSQPTTVTVVEVVDGDTLDVEFPDGTRETVRLLGVDTPEVHVENDPAEFEGVPDSEAGHRWLRDWGHRASEFARTELAGENVTVQTDPTADRRGSYGRLLVYVGHDGEEFNRELLEQGYARLYDSQFDRRDRYAGAEADARATDVGLWGFTETWTASPTAERTVLADGGGPLAVAEIRADAPGNDHENPNREFVVFENVGDEPLDLAGWRVRDEAGHSYEFPAGFTLAPGAAVTLYSGSGADTDSELYWDAGGAVWNNGGDAVVVLDADGEHVLTREYD